MSGGLIALSCYECGETFGLLPSVHQQLKRSSATFHCPWGHGNYFPAGPTEADKLRSELSRERQRIERLVQEGVAARSEAEHHRRRALGFQGAAAKIRKRVGQGTCPCCKRTFKQLAAHMASQHPTFTKEETTP